ALPTELWHLSVFASAKVRLFPEPCKHFTKKMAEMCFFHAISRFFQLSSFYFQLFFVPLHRFSKPFGM
ncbi:MAG: hypothetical protein II675_07600, partial [Bacteroidaceae bacterium]|nr:hypothetical protein [Bacteroidaceae bacterium]